MKSSECNAAIIYPFDKSLKESYSPKWKLLLWIFLSEVSGVVVGLRDPQINHVIRLTDSLWSDRKFTFI
jgi:hypothetical protein